MPYTESAGARIYWDERGSGEPLLMIMGLGATSEWWIRLLPALSARYRTVVFDNRGMGRSDVPPGPYSIALMADDALAVLDAARIEAAHVLGVSMGGFIAQELAIRHPERVRSLALGCTACGGREAVVAAPEVLAALRDVATLPREQARRAMVPYIYDPSTPRVSVEEDLAVALGAAFSPQGYAAQLQAIMTWPGTYTRLESIRMPTLILHGETDRLVPPDNARVLASAIPHARVVMLPTASHMFPTEQLDATVGALLSFFADASAQASHPLEARG